jgi:hypothetical protein
MRIIALSKPEELRGLEPGTLNRHLTFIDQLFDLAEAEGVELDPKLNGEHPYLHIAKNKFRRIKNAQSKRNIVIHPELIRLGFLKYLSLIRSLGYELVFPDLFSPTTKSPLGNRYYKLFKPVLVAAGITEEGLGSHALRHAFGAILKKRDVREEHRADLLGHSGKSETSERYCEATEIEAMYKLVCTMPIVTGHLVAHPINLFHWIIEKKTAPFLIQVARGTQAESSNLLLADAKRALADLRMTSICNGISGSD